MSCLAIDIGNTCATVATVRGRRVGAPRALPTTQRSSAVLDRFLSECLAGQAPVDGAAIGSVVPGVTRSWERAIKRVLGIDALLVDHTLKLGVGIDYPNPASIGADRLANACGAVSRYGAPVIVADFGTALTFDVVNRAGDYVGGVIAPGLPLMVDYLSERTALLPRIGLKGAIRRVGRSTAGAMRIGAQIGYRGIVHEIVDFLRSDPRERGAALCATGGHARWVLKGLALDFAFDPKLTLRGLAVIHNINTSGSIP